MSIITTLLAKAFWIGIAGALGAGARHSVGMVMRRAFGDRFPWGTLVINLSGAFAIGLITALLSQHSDLSAWKGPLVIGFLGGYTTFSTVMLEGAHLRRSAQHHYLAWYLATTALLGPLLAFAGMAIGGAR